jgi:hypothetical protein
MRPVATDRVPARMRVLPKLNALIGMPNPIVTNPAAVASRPTTNNTSVICFPSLNQNAGGGHRNYQIVTAIRIVRKNIPFYTFAQSTNH